MLLSKATYRYIKKMLFGLNIHSDIPLAEQTSQS